MQPSDIQQLIKDLLNTMGVAYEDVREVESVLPEHRRFEIVTSESGPLIGRDGKHLRALSHLVRVLAEKRAGDTPLPSFYIDVGGYVSNQIKQVEHMALTMANRARSFKRNVELPPMNPLERMWVHALLSPFHDLETESFGVGKHRHVTIKFKG